MRATATITRGPTRRATRRPPGRPNSQRKWTDSRGPVTTNSANTLGYNSITTDRSTGDQQLGSRTYDPAKGTYTTADGYRTGTAAQNQSVSSDPLTEDTYNYVNGDPLNLNDPDGHMPCVRDGDGPPICGSLRAVAAKSASITSVPAVPSYDSGVSHTSYHYTYNLGNLGTPRELDNFLRSDCSQIFPISGCADNFVVGQKLFLSKQFLFYTQGFPVRVLRVTPDSFTFVALKGHPEGAGRTITFSFHQATDGSVSLNVDTSSNGSPITQLPIIRHLDFDVAEHTWSTLALNLSLDYIYEAFPGGPDTIDPELRVKAGLGLIPVPPPSDWPSSREHQA